MEDKPENSNEEMPVYNVLKQIKEGTLDPKTMSTEQRRSCVEVLKIEGQSIAAIAALLQWSEKTIHRDWVAIGKRNVEKPSPELALRLIAQLIMKETSKEDYLTRLANSKDGSMQEKAQAMYYSHKVMHELAQLLQSMGYLPTQPTKIITDVYQHQSDESDPVKLKEEVDRIEKIIKEECVNDPSIVEKLDVIKKKIEVLELNKQIIDLSNQVTDKSNQVKENENEQH